MPADQIDDHLEQLEQRLGFTNTAADHHARVWLSRERLDDLALGRGIGFDEAGVGCDSLGIELRLAHGDRHLHLCGIDSRDGAGIEADQ